MSWRPGSLLRRLKSGPERSGAGRSLAPVGGQEHGDVPEHAGGTVHRRSTGACSCQALLLSEARYATLFRQTRDGVVIVDKSGTVLQVNTAAKTLLGRPGKVVRGLPLRDLLSVEEQDQFMKGLERIPEVDGHHWEVDLVRKGGLALPVEISAARLPDERIVLSLRDLRLRREMEQARTEGEKLNAVGRLTAGIVHELRNPLFVISNILHAMREDLDSEPSEILDDLDMALEESHRARGIIDNLLGFVRPADGEKCLLDPEPVIRQILAVFQAAFDQKNIHLKIDIAESGPCHFNPDAFKQVMINLVSNALDAMSDGGRLTITAAPSTSGGVRISVEDNGCGMPPQVRKEIFAPFYSTKKGGHGNGLGLWIVHLTLKRYGGRAQVESTQGRGTKFILELAAPGEHDEECAIEEDSRPARR